MNVKKTPEKHLSEGKSFSKLQRNFTFKQSGKIQFSRLTKSDLLGELEKKIGREMSGWQMSS